MTFIIAEAGINHNGDLNTAKKMIDVAKEAGVDCVKFQTFTAKELSADAGLKYKGQNQEKFFRRYEFSKKEWAEIIGYCRKQKITFSTTCQNPSDLDFILSLTDLPFLKVGSDDLTNLSLLRYYARKKKPMIISAGMAYEDEIKDAVDTCKKVGNKDITILHCVSLYPAKAKEINLIRMKTIKEKFKVSVGFSDHSEDNYAAFAAVALGAGIIEKHFTLNKNMQGSDHAFSANPEQLKELVFGIRFIEKAVGRPEIFPSAGEKKMRKIVRRSIVASADLQKGKKIILSDIELKRPGTGIPPKFINKVIGKKVKKNIKKGELISFKKLNG